MFASMSVGQTAGRVVGLASVGQRVLSVSQGNGKGPWAGKKEDPPQGLCDGSGQGRPGPPRIWRPFPNGCLSAYALHPLELGDGVDVADDGSQLREEG